MSISKFSAILMATTAALVLLTYRDAPGLSPIAPDVESRAFAGACCLTTASAACTTCTVVTGCALAAGTCNQTGGIDGCSIAGTRRVCGGWTCPYTVCVNSNGASVCGQSKNAPSCAVTTVAGVIVSCVIPAVNTCAGAGSVECQNCTATPL